MSPPSASARELAIKALYRIRAVEAPPDSEGHKTVWHQCAGGADLVTIVDARGRVLRQEFTLLGDYFLWEPDRPVVTGGVEDGGRGVIPRLDVDWVMSLQRIGRAAEALGSYDGSDRYLDHLRRQFHSLGRKVLAEEPVTDVGHPVPVPAATGWRRVLRLLAGLLGSVGARR